MEGAAVLFYAGSICEQRCPKLPVQHLPEHGAVSFHSQPCTQGLFYRTCFVYSCCPSRSSIQARGSGSQTGKTLTPEKKGGMVLSRDGGAGREVGRGKYSERHLLSI
jgi:hypothetical protein